jgi:hypothetical protein
MTKTRDKYMVNVYITEEQAKKIEQMKAESGDSESSIVRRMIEKCLNMKQK